MHAQDTANHIFIDRDAESQGDLLGNAGEPQLGFRLFISTTAPMSSFSGPFGRGRRPRFDENNMRYLRFLSRLWKYSRVEKRSQIIENTLKPGSFLKLRRPKGVRDRVEGFNTMAERKMRDRRMNRVHKPVMIRSPARTLGARLHPRQHKLR